MCSSEGKLNNHQTKMSGEAFVLPLANTSGRQRWWRYWGPYRATSVLLPFLVLHLTSSLGILTMWWETIGVADVTLKALNITYFFRVKIRWHWAGTQPNMWQSCVEIGPSVPRGGADRKRRVDVNLLLPYRWGILVTLEWGNKDATDPRREKKTVMSSLRGRDAALVTKGRVEPADGSRPSLKWPGGE